MVSDMKCSPLPCLATGGDPEHGHHNDCGSTMNSNTSCTPTCDKGYHLEPSKKVCHLGSIEKEPVCVEDWCDATALPENALDAGNCNGKLKSGDTCQPTCKEGYFPDGKRTCDKGVLSESSSHSDGKFVCREKPCTETDSTAVIENGLPGGDCTKALLHGESCTPACKYVHMIRNNVECLHDGKNPVEEVILGKYETLELCADACRSETGCHYFQYGVSNTNKARYCVWKKAQNEVCLFASRWQPITSETYTRQTTNSFTSSSEYDFYSILTGDKDSQRYAKVGYQLKGTRKCKLGKIENTAQCVSRKCTMETPGRLLNSFPSGFYGTPRDLVKIPDSTSGECKYGTYEGGTDINDCMKDSKKDTTSSSRDNVRGRCYNKKNYKDKTYDNAITLESACTAAGKSWRESEWVATKIVRDNSLWGMNVPTRLYGHVKTWNIDWKRFLGAKEWQSTFNACPVYKEDLKNMCDAEVKSMETLAEKHSFAICPQTEKHIVDFKVPDYSNKKFLGDENYVNKGLSKCDPTNVKYFGGKFFWRLNYFTEKYYTNSEKYSEIRKEIQKACHNPEADEGLIDDCIEFRRDECKKQAGKNVDGSEHHKYTRLFYTEKCRRDKNCWHAKASQCQNDHNGDGVEFGKLSFRITSSLVRFV